MKNTFKTFIVTSLSLVSLNAFAIFTYTGDLESINCSWECADGSDGQGWEGNAGDCEARANADCGEKVVGLHFGNPLLQGAPSKDVASENIKPIKPGPVVIQVLSEGQKKSFSCQSEE